MHFLIGKCYSSVYSTSFTFSNVKRQCCPNVTELMLSQLTYTPGFLPLFNIGDERYNNSGQMFSAQWEPYTECTAV